MIQIMLSRFAFDYAYIKLACRILIGPTPSWFYMGRLVQDCLAIIGTQDLGPPTFLRYLVFIPTGAI